MAVAFNAGERPIEHRFAQFRLIPAARELWKDGQLCHTPPLVFDCLVYLLENRQRMVGRDELVSAVWGRVDVADQQVRQLIQRARQAVGDEARSQHVIRTVSGSGYRWVMAIESAEAPVDAASTASSAAYAPPALEPAAQDWAPDFRSDVPAASSPSPSPASEPDARPLRRRAPAYAGKAVMVAGVLALLVAAFVYWHERRAGPARPPQSPGVASPALAVLPLEVTGPLDAGWVRLGAMDLIAQRLRSTGMPVSPSDNVVSATLAVGEADTPERLAKLRATLGAATLVQGAAVKSAAGWQVDLSAVSADGQRRTAQAQRPDIVEAARDAADLLLVTLGMEPPPREENSRDDLDWLLQRARAALLVNQLDAARSILAGAPESLSHDPRVRFAAARIEQRAGKLDVAESALRALLGDPALAADADTRVDVLMALGDVEMSRVDCAAGERFFDRALNGPQDRSTARHGKALSTRATARACLSRFDDAIKDLSAAGPLLDAAGDRLGRANLNNHFGLLELYRGRPAQAVGYLESARAIHQSFASVYNVRGDLALLCSAFSQLLRWPQALDASAALWAMHGQVDDASTLYLMAGVRARVLVATGQYREAESLLRGVEAAHPEGGDKPLALTFHEAKADLFWARGDATRTIAAIDAAWNLIPPSKMRDDEDLYTVLLRQRAAFSLGQAASDDSRLGVPGIESNAAAVVPLLVAQAERDDRAGRFDEAEAGFRKAVASAEARDVPASLVLAVDAYARWLLARGRLDEARETAGRISAWADRDFDSALLQAIVFRASGAKAAWQESLRRASALAGERELPAAAEGEVP
ncbi:winged helix-turn-helix domain-containing protein [Dokdonella sp.]|uniref:winged helix-turn-helix domain-containing protein n=1 Tax=Dokdonella sp. TaxID=2291710 RepID=UPI001B0BFA03|nr:winged helix-turn-helix domain-containing protein [Dokdonella sp.]MBO9661998.1 winged helix-turn-helix domain-containing protein [Dokdonella sp.]